MSQLAHLSLTFCAVTGMVILHFFVIWFKFSTIAALYFLLTSSHTISRRLTVRRLTVPWKMHARFFVWKPWQCRILHSAQCRMNATVEKHWTVQNVTKCTVHNECYSGETFNSAESYTAFTTFKKSNHITKCLVFNTVGNRNFFCFRKIWVCPWLIRLRLLIMSYVSNLHSNWEVM